MRLPPPKVWQRPPLPPKVMPLLQQIPVTLPRPTQVMQAPQSLRSARPPKLQLAAGKPNHCTPRADRPHSPTPRCSRTIV
jgi:hypothetical protein